MFRDALTLRERLHGDRHAEVAESVHNLAVLLAVVRDPARRGEIERLARRGLTLRRKLLGEQDGEPAVDPTIFADGFEAGHTLLWTSEVSSDSRLSAPPPRRSSSESTSSKTARKDPAAA